VHERGLDDPLTLGAIGLAILQLQRPPRTDRIADRIEHHPVEPVVDRPCSARQKPAVVAQRERRLVTGRGQLAPQAIERAPDDRLLQPRRELTRHEQRQQLITLHVHRARRHPVLGDPVPALLRVLDGHPGIP